MSAVTPTDFTSFADDPIYRAMRDGTISWADLCEDLVYAPSASAEKPKADPPKVLEYGWDFEYPELRLRKDIWENFPVTVTPLGAGPDGAERHAVAWHRSKLAEWRETKPTCFADWMDYEMDTEHRLFKCLEASKYWTLEDPTADGQLCIIRMNFVPRDAAATTIVAAAAPDAADESDDDDAFIAVFAKGKAPKAAPIPAPRPTVPSVPLFTRLNDIKEHFPVVWHKVEDAHTRTAVYALEIFGKKAREMALSTRVAEAAFRAEMEPKLLAALRASPAWRVLRSEGREFCRLEMA